MYAISSFQEQDNSSNVVTSMIKVFCFDVYALLDPSMSLYVVTPYIVMTFNIITKHFLEPFSVTKLIGL